MMDIYHNIKRIYIIFSLLLLITNIMKIEMTGPPLSTIKDKKITIFKFHNCCGLNSNLMNMIAYKMYYNDIGRSFVVDEYEFNGIGNRTLSKYFLSTFPIIYDKDTSEIYTEQHQIENINDDIRNPKADFTVLSFMDFGHAMINEIKDKFKTCGVEGYNRMAKEACADLRFSGFAKKSIITLKQQMRIPNFDKKITAGFHIRRGDKVDYRESKKHDASDYVKKLLRAMSSSSYTEGKTIEYCFVATDDYEVVEELQAALNKYEIGCTLYSLVQPQQKGNQQEEGQQKEMSHEQILQFLTEMSMLIDVSYFIGTFDSNVGSIVSLLRSCKWNRKEEVNYFHSYGVDRDDFHMM